MSIRESEWYDEFWSPLGDIEADIDGISAIRLIGEMYADGLIDRDGDFLIGNDVDDHGETANRTYLSTSDQFLVRRIFEAVDRANGAER